jgi:hypothetical protein
LHSSNKDMVHWWTIPTIYGGWRPLVWFRLRVLWWVIW